MKKISDEELIKNLKDLEKKLGRIPNKTDLQVNKGSKYCASAYTRAFGGIAKALVVSGFKPGQIRALSEEEVLEDIKKIYKMLNRTPTIEEYQYYSSISYSAPTLKEKFGSWTKALIAANIPIVNAGKADKKFILEELQKWYDRHSQDVNSLSYWKIRKAKENRRFPFCAETIKNNFPDMSWQDIMKQVDPTYKTKDPFIYRQNYLGNDNNHYLSLLELEAGNYLYNLMKENKIKNYQYEATVCNNKSWTCDFLITKNDDKKLWLEIDGMRNNRKNPYSQGNNDKINYYKENGLEYKIVSYNNKNMVSALNLAIFSKENKDGKTE